MKALCGQRGRFQGHHRSLPSCTTGVKVHEVDEQQPAMEFSSACCPSIWFWPGVRARPSWAALSQCHRTLLFIPPATPCLWWCRQSLWGRAQQVSTGMSVKRQAWQELFQARFIPKTCGLLAHPCFEHFPHLKTRGGFTLCRFLVRVETEDDEVAIVTTLSPRRHLCPCPCPRVPAGVPLLDGVSILRCKPLHAYVNQHWYVWKTQKPFFLD